MKGEVHKAFYNRRWMPIFFFQITGEIMHKRRAIFYVFHGGTLRFPPVNRTFPPWKTYVSRCGNVKESEKDWYLRAYVSLNQWEGGKQPFIRISF